MSAHPLDIRLAHLEGSYEQISDRLNGFDLRFARIEEKVDSGFGRVDDRFDRMQDRMERGFDEIRRLIITGAVTIGGFVLASIVLPLLTHALR